MKQYDIEHLRAIAVTGATGSGKTSFMESVLFVTGAKDKKGSVENKDTTSDYLQEEKDHLSSIQTSLIPIEHNGYKFNFLDLPGNRELVNEVYQALSVVKGAVIMVDGSKGIDIGTELVLSDLSERNIPTIIFSNFVLPNPLSKVFDDVANSGNVAFLIFFCISFCWFNKY